MIIMGLQGKIGVDMVKAMKGKQTAELSLLRVVSGEFSRSEFYGVDKKISDENAIKVIRKMSNDAKELNNQFEVDFLEKYLPKMMSEPAIRAMVEDLIYFKGYSGMKDMGKVMNDMKNPLVDGNIASKIVRELLG